MLALTTLGLLGSAHAQTPPGPPPVPRTIGLFSDVEVTQPPGEVKQVVLLLSGTDALSPADRALARRLAQTGAMVAAVPLTPFYTRLAAQSGPSCAYAGGAVENLSRRLQATARLPTYLEPMLLGTGGAGAAFAYSTLAQAPAGTFASALSLGFCPHVVAKPPPCATAALKWTAAEEPGAVDLLPAAQLPAPWAVIHTPDAGCAAAVSQAFVDKVPQGTFHAAVPADTGATVPAAFDAAYAQLAAKHLALGPPPAQVADLPVVEVPAADAAPTSNRFAVLLSGDGGWAGIDKGIATGFADQGVPVVGFDSLRYFWSARSPEGLAADLDRLIRFYGARWKRNEVILVGFSQGADVLPFAVNRLPLRTRSRVKLTALLGPGLNASFEFHVTNWIGESGDRPIEPEARKLPAATTLCVYGTNEKNSLCPLLPATAARPLALPGGHHFGGDYDALAARILEAVPR